MIRKGEEEQEKNTLSKVARAVTLGLPRSSFEQVLFQEKALLCEFRASMELTWKA